MFAIRNNTASSSKILRLNFHVSISDFVKTKTLVKCNLNLSNRHMITYVRIHTKQCQCMNVYKYYRMYTQNTKLYTNNLNPDVVTWTIFTLYYYELRGGGRYDQTASGTLSWPVSTGLTSPASTTHHGFYF